MLTLFDLFAVAAMPITYALAECGHRFVLLFAPHAPPSSHRGGGT
ncbi:MAG: hypothetical protein ACOY3N_30195 [Bradyrhizobium sp.]|nr:MULTISPECIES: hypothetical protein [Bradyrhizobium]